VAPSSTHAPAPATPPSKNGAVSSTGGGTTTPSTPPARFTSGRIVLTQQSNATIALRANVGTSATPQQVIPIDAASIQATLQTTTTSPSAAAAAVTATSASGPAPKS
jgi:hypothetical protein